MGPLLPFRSFTHADAFRATGLLYGPISLGPPSITDDHDEPIYQDSCTTPWEAQLELLLQVVEDDTGRPAAAAREHTLESIASAIGVTRERVRQIESRAISKLRRTHPELREWL